MKELERKFKLKFMPVNGSEDFATIKQAYLLLDGPKHLRVRIVDDRVAWMTYKEIVSKEEKKEYEYSIPIADALELYENAEHKLVKKRYHGTFKNYHVDIDEYPNGLRVVEIEYEDELKEIPEFCGEEITGEKEYSNIQFAINGDMKSFI